MDDDAAQMIASGGNRLFYHTWKKDDGVHFYEIDFLIASNAKIVPMEIKSSNVNTHKSISDFCKSVLRRCSGRTFFCRNLSGAFFDMPDSQEVCMGRKFDDLSLEEKIAHFDGKRRAGGHH